MVEKIDRGDKLLVQKMDYSRLGSYDVPENTNFERGNIALIYTGEDWNVEIDEIESVPRDQRIREKNSIKRKFKLVLREIQLFRRN